MIEINRFDHEKTKGPCDQGNHRDLQGKSQRVAKAGHAREVSAGATTLRNEAEPPRDSIITHLVLAALVWLNQGAQARLEDNVVNFLQS